MDLTRILVLIFALAQAGLGLSLLGHFLLGFREGSRKMNANDRELTDAGEAGVKKKTPKARLP